MTAAWHLLTGEYPPARGGVGDYTHLLAEGLADAGAEVHVWAPAGASHDGVTVHPIGGFHRGGRAALDAALGGGDPGRVLLVQYAPQAFGWRGANVPFCRWVARRARAGDQVRVMFHEPWVPFGLRPRRLALALATRWMARLLLGAAARVYVSVPAWEGLLAPWAPRGAPRAEWLPVPSTIPRADGGDGMRPAEVVGHFGTYGDGVAPLLEAALTHVLDRRRDAVALLAGRGSDRFARDLQRRHATLQGRIESAEGGAETISRALRRMTVAVQPYPDGATARRTTLMAALAHGVPVATCLGRFSEEVWADAGLPLAAVPEEIGPLAVALLADPARRAAAAQAGAALYRERFDLRHTVRRLLG